jgi:hypothetical protein
LSCSERERIANITGGRLAAQLCPISLFTAQQQRHPGILRRALAPPLSNRARLNKASSAWQHGRAAQVPSSTRTKGPSNKPKIASKQNPLVGPGDNRAEPPPLNVNEPPFGAGKVGMRLHRGGQAPEMPTRWEAGRCRASHGAHARFKAWRASRASIPLFPCYRPYRPASWKLRRCLPQGTTRQFP